LLSVLRFVEDIDISILDDNLLAPSSVSLICGIILRSFV
jgi:hypothetical protein